MAVQLPDPLVRKLIALPETGMGYQLVDLSLADGRVVRRVQVLNSELALIPDDFGTVDPASVRDVSLSPRQ
ncbi:hypothetical protein [Chthonobacter albigriseus]|uniref:hypothetical protein n=1 Tax=Chthonobacter albigriseus TaxID=1683161 RepID=UPI0015EF001F|nr:hypothetical protein [Chthonobacter albigriseus]